MLPFVSLLLFGLVIGVIAKIVWPSRDPGGFIITILVGISGALVGGWLGRLLGLHEASEPIGFLMALLGSVILLAVYRLAARARRVL